MQNIQNPRELHMKIMQNVKICDYLDSTLQAIHVLRAGIKNLKDIPETSNLEGMGIYFLIGDSDELERPEIYIGESENVLKRITEHTDNFDWNSCICIVSLKNYFNKAFIKYLETRFILKANLSNCRVRNKNTSQNTDLEYGKITLERVIPDIEGYLSTLGFTSFEKTEDSSDPIFQCSIGNEVAYGKYQNGKFTVLKNSNARYDESSSMSLHNSLLKKVLVDSGILKNLGGNSYIFTEDYAFNSPSSAACIVKGQNISGWLVWKTMDGRLLKDVY
ncbi:conserved hypothetical protein [Methanococcus maripaludis C5]|uniref:DUF4357 domain-containing protein n=1 Tax=Methanococcus maripaludis (strain C5 / ATCC BAA-1333) TaxID=402880 RepID=A4FZZ8_METM5|nr:GIY-YIG nuclease family protein [Methanococcus maripaludis]ABO35782.1 conserved hypothetical protein [Methanococcus maripaludis C5]